MNSAPPTTSRRAVGQLFVLLLALLVFLVASCGDDSEPTTADESADETTDTDTDTATDESTEPSADVAVDDAGDGVELLIGCETNIADDVPEFYATYFRCADVSMDGDTVVIVSVNEPPHLSAYYPEDDPRYEAFDTSRGADYRQNPNTITGETNTVRIPANPAEQGTIIDARTVNAGVGDDTDYPLGTAGIALDGVAYFNPLAGPGDDIEDEVFTFDSLSGHPQQNGNYHYHGTSVGPLRVLWELGAVTTDVVGEAEVELYGVMCDGTVLFGGTELDGSAAAGELDLQNGHTHDIVDSDGTVLLENRYHIHMAAELSLDPRGLTPEAQYYSTCDLN